MSEQKVVITDYQYETTANEERVITEAGGTLYPFQCKNEEDIIAVAHDAVGLLVQYRQITPRVLDALHKLQVISRYAVGVDNIDIAAASEKGIYVANVPDYCQNEVSDHVIALLMACFRKLFAAHQFVKNGNWDFKQMKPIHSTCSSVVGFVGFGMIPRNLAPKLKAIGFELIAYAPRTDQETMAHYGVQRVEFKDIFTHSDFVSLHVPLNERTRGLIGPSQLAAMKPSAYLINISRGPVVDEAALIDALRNGEIAGAALDVIEKEPVNPDNPLLKMDNVIITPHMAWYSEEAQAELQTRAAENIASVLKGGIPKHCLNQKAIEGKSK